MRKERLADTESGVLAEEVSALLQPHEISDSMTVLWLSRPERRGWRGGQHWHRQADSGTDC